MNYTSNTPTLIIPRRIFVDIAYESTQHPSTETGAALIGVETKDLIVVIATIPDIVNIHRSAGLFKNGGDYQAEVFRWYQKHWNMARKKSRQMTQINWTPSTPLPDGYIPPELDLDLAYLGDWHKHPGSMTHLSGTDIATIRQILSDRTESREQILSPIVTFYKGGNFGRRLDISKNQVIMSSGDEFRINWYYTHRNSRTTEIVPFPVSNKNVPTLPPVSWYLTDPQRFDDELLYLGMQGFETAWRVADINNDSVCEMVFAVNSPNWSKQVIVSTSWDYPKTHATIFITDKVQHQEEVEINSTIQEDTAEQVEILEQANDESVEEVSQDIEIPEVIGEAAVQEVIEQVETLEQSAQNSELMQPVEEAVAIPQSEPEFQTFGQPDGTSLFMKIKNRIAKKLVLEPAVQEELRLPVWNKEVYIADLIIKIEEQLI